MVVVQVEVVLGADQLNLLHWTRPLLHIHRRRRSHYRSHCLASQFLEFIEHSLFDEKAARSPLSMNHCPVQSDKQRVLQSLHQSLTWIDMLNDSAVNHRSKVG